MRSAELSVEDLGLWSRLQSILPLQDVIAAELAGLPARLDARFERDPAWIAARDSAADAATVDWTGRELVLRLSGQAPQ